MARDINHPYHWIKRFWAKVDKTGDCWIYTGWSDKDGYGVFGNRRPWCLSYQDINEILAHRISWVLENGPIPAGLWVLHNCDNPPCIKPPHLFLGTCQDNHDDMDTKNRRKGPKGERCKHTHLTEPDIVRIRELYKGGISQYKIADIYQINQTSVSEIVNRLSWGHIP